MQIIKAMQLKTTNSIAFLEVIIPEGISLIAVRGFKASNVLSSHRLKAMAALLAKIIHATTNKNTCHHGFSFVDLVCARARKNPINAKGIAKMVCENFTSER